MTRKVAKGASSADFTTTALPAASAGAILNAISIRGAFHGRMAPTTPIGSRWVKVSMVGENGTVSPFNSPARRSEEHTSELQSLMRISYAVFCLKKKKQRH